LTTEPPEEPPEEPGDPYGEPPEESSDDPYDEPRHEPGDRYREPSEEPPEELHAHDREPPDEPGARYREPPDEPGEPPPPPPPEEEPYERYRRLHEPPEEEPPSRLFEAPEDAEALGDHPTGELFDDEFPGDLPAVPTSDLLGDLGEEVHSTAELAKRRAQERALRRRAGRQRLLFLVLGVVVVVVIVVLVVGGGSGTPTPPAPSSNPLAATGTGAGHLLAGSSASALPGNILVADRNNDRVISLSPQGRVVWTVRLTGPSDAFLSPTARSITVTQPGAFVVLQLAVADKTAFYRYGHSGRPGSADDRLHDPETAQEQSDGKLVIADKANCRILFISPPSVHPSAKLGTPGSCVHDPPKSLAYPDAVFPAIGGGIVVTELDPAWVDVLSSTDRVVAHLRVPGLSAPDDANEYAPGKLIATSHSHPGAVEEFNTAGKVFWTYPVTTGSGELNRPSLAEVLPSGDVLVCDSGNDRIVVIDPQTNTIIWQYGHTGKPGSKPGYLHTPDSAVLVP
jgi:outer membrane protein assembly factor BamB